MTNGIGIYCMIIITVWFLIGMTPKKNKNKL